MKPISIVKKIDIYPGSTAPILNDVVILKYPNKKRITIIALGIGKHNLYKPVPYNGPRISYYHNTILSYYSIGGLVRDIIDVLQDKKEEP